jgi:tetratricopeptide (TPR) repeat protein
VYRAATPTKSPTERDPDPIVALADRIDPGEVATIDAMLPPWLASALRVTDLPDTKAIADSLANDHRWWLPIDAAENGPALRQLLQAAASLERRVAKLHGAERLDAEFVLLEVYRRLGVPAIGSRDEASATRIGTSLLAGAEIGDFDRVWPVVRNAMKDAPQRQRRLLAQVMRRADQHDPRLPMAMAMTSDRPFAPTAQDVELLRAAIDLLGERALPGTLLDAAQICTNALAIECADDMLARVHAAPDDATVQRLIRERATSIDKARRILALGDATKLDEQLERAKLLREIGRVEEASRAYGELAQRHPNDARALVGRERSRLHLELDFVAAAARIDAFPKGLDHRDAEFYEYVIGVRATALGSAAYRERSDPDPLAAMERIAPIVEPDVRALAALGSDAGAVMQYVLDFSRGDMLRIFDDDGPGAVGDRVLTDMMAMRERFPNSVHVHRVLIAAAIGADDRALAERALALPLPADADEQLVRADLTARRAVAMMSDKPQPATDEDQEDQLAIDAVAIEARDGNDPQRWTELAERYGAPVRTGVVIPMRRANAIAVSVAQSGDLAQARKLFEEMVAFGRTNAGGFDRDIPLLNLVALGGGSRTELEEIAKGSNEVVRPTALAMLVEGSRGAERRRWKALLAREGEVACQDAVRGILMTAGFNFELTYNTMSGMRMGVDYTLEPWLMVDAAIAPLQTQSCRTTKRPTSGV